MNKNVWLMVGCVVAVLIASYILFKWVGFNTIFISIILFFLPTYIMLKQFNIEEDERIFFSFFIGLGIFPLVVWWFNRMNPSLTVSMVTVWILLTLTGLILWRKKL